MNIIYPMFVTGFDALQENDKKEAYTAGEELFCAIVYLE